MKNIGLSILGILYIILGVTLFFPDRLIVAFIPWKQTIRFKYWIRESDQVLQSLIRVVGFYLGYLIYNFL